MKYVLALDQGTTSSRALLFDPQGNVAATASRPVPARFPAPGYVEQDPLELLQTQVACLREAAAGREGEILCLGIANQRETVVLWDARTGDPVGPAIGWQCRRTADLCDRLIREGWEAEIQRRTGLRIDPYFSGTKIAWALRHLPEARRLADQGHLRFGTVDAFLRYRLTGRHQTDPANASRTMLFNLERLDWDEELLRALGIPPSLLPTVGDNCGELGLLKPEILGRAIPVTGVAGDQQAALYGQACFAAGQAKNTYGTGCFLLQNIGAKPLRSQDKLLTTVAWRIAGQTTYAMEGSVFMGGATVQWLRDQLGLIRTAAESEAVAASVPDTGGVYLVPAFTGLGAPYWDMRGRGTLVGMTRGTGRAQVVRAGLESIAYQCADVLAACQRDGGQVTLLRVDGGACANDLLMQFQADLLGVPLLRPRNSETTALGAAMLAGRGAGLWTADRELEALNAPERAFLPQMDPSERARRLAGWHKAVDRARGWEEPGQGATP